MTAYNIHSAAAELKFLVNQLCRAAAVDAAGSPVAQDSILIAAAVCVARLLAIDLLQATPQPMLSQQTVTQQQQNLPTA